MKIPYTISKRILTLYQPFADISETGRKIFAEDFEEWDKRIPKPLKELCILSIARNWTVQPLFKEIPQLADRLLLLDVLPTELSLESTVPIIHEDVYWKRCYEERWPKQLPNDIIYSTHACRSSTPSSTDKTITHYNAHKSEYVSKIVDDIRTWKCCYLEMHVKEVLENLRPEDYEPEEVKFLWNICAPYVQVLNLTQLQCSYKGSTHIPLGTILCGFCNLRELCITFQQTYVEEAFRWNMFKTSFDDIQQLCKAFENMTKLNTLKIFRSDIDCEKFSMITNSSLMNTLKEIDFYSCNMPEDGVVALCKVVIKHNNCLEKISLANNKLGSTAAQALSEVISIPASCLTFLDLRLNPIGPEGGRFLFESLTAQSLNLQELILAGCGIKCSGIYLCDMLKKNNTLLNLDFSNNCFCEDIGNDILISLETNRTLIKFDLRMCHLTSEVKHAVKVLLERNKKIITQKER